MCRHAIALATWTIVVPLAGCASALRPPEPLPSIEGEGPAASDEQAEELWGTRALASVREAAEGYERRIARRYDPFGSAVGASRAWTWIARRAPTEDERREAAGRAVRVAQWCGEIEPSRAECEYWLAAALGVQAEQRRSTALDALPRIVALFESAAVRIPDYENGGPDRALALLFARAPGFPIGPGDADLAVEHARAAVGLAPGFAPNLAALAEALQATGRSDGAGRAWHRAAEEAAAAVERGEPESAEWLEQAREALRALDR